MLVFTRDENWKYSKLLLMVHVPSNLKIFSESIIFLGERDFIFLAFLNILCCLCTQSIRARSLAQNKNTLPLTLTIWKKNALPLTPRPLARANQSFRKALTLRSVLKNELRSSCVREKKRVPLSTLLKRAALIHDLKLPPSLALISTFLAHPDPSSSIFHHWNSPLAADFFTKKPCMIFE